MRRARVDLDLGLESCLRERVAQHVLGLRLVLVVVLGDRKQILRLHLRDEEMRAVVLIGH